MRRLALALSVVLLVVMALPTRLLSAPRTIDYQPIDIGDRIRSLPAGRDMIVNPEAAAAAFGDAARGGSGQDRAGIQGVGEQKLFLVLDDTLGRFRFAMFTLRAVGQYGEVWVQNDLNFPAGDPRNPVTVTDDMIAHLLREFDTNIYPKESAMWTTPDRHTGEHALLSEWGLVPPNYYTPSDGVERVIILVSNVQDANYYDPNYPIYIAGFYSPTLELYFDRNVMTIDAFDWANRTGPNDAPWRPDDGPANDRPFLYEGVFAHEYQHLLHDDLDSDEDSWINEGMSDFAEFLTGYSDLNTNSHIDAFLRHPYNSLVAWEDRGPLEVLSDYGAAFLMQLYLHQRYGAEFIRRLAYEQANGIDGVNATLAAMGIPDSFPEIYQDWTTAVLINDRRLAGGRYTIAGLDKRVVPDGEGDSGPDALAWGPAYHVIPARPKIKGITIGGISFLPTPWSVTEDPLQPGNQVLYSGGGNLTDNMLILPLDLSSSTGTTLRFRTLYDIEEFWDFGMVQVSTDGGETWHSLSNGYTTDTHDPNAHPDIVANLPGLTGASGGWVEMSFDLSAYDGQRVLLAFRYMTDWAAEGNGVLPVPGWYIDDIQVAGFTSDGSSLEPFHSIDEIRQRYAQYLITFVGRKRTGNAQWKVLHLRLISFTEGDQQELKKFLHDSSLDEVIMIVSRAAPPGDNASAPFHFTVERQSDHPNPKGKGKKK